MNAAARRLAAAVAAGIAALAMLVSFRALAELAERWHALPEGMGWTLPLMLDGLAVAGGVAALARRLDGHRAVYPWLLVMVGAGASLAGNVAHAPEAPGARLVAATPAIVAALALHLAMEEARRRNRHAAAAEPASPAPESASEPAEPPVPAAAPAAERVPEPAEPAATVVAAGSARDLARAYLTAHPGRVTGTELASAIGTSPEYARRLLREYRASTGTGRAGTNGAAPHRERRT